jgi:excisionase family DNA binding protein
MSQNRESPTHLIGTDELLTTVEAARLLRVHINTIRKWADAGALKSFRIGPRRDRRFFKKDVMTLLHANRRV